MRPIADIVDDLLSAKSAKRRPVFGEITEDDRLIRNLLSADPQPVVQREYTPVPGSMDTRTGKPVMQYTPTGQPSTDFGTIVKAGTVDDINLKIRDYAEARGIPAERYRIANNGEIIYQGDDGKWYPETKATVGGMLKRFAGETVAHLPAIAMATIGAAGGAGSAAIGGAGGEGIRQTVGALLHRDQAQFDPRVNVGGTAGAMGKMALEGTLAGVGEKVGGGMVRLIDRTQGKQGAKLTQIVGRRGRGRLDPQEMREMIELGRQYGIELNIPQATGSHELIARYKLLGDLPVTADKIGKANLKQYAEIDRAVGDWLRSIAPDTTTPGSAGARAVEAAEGTIAAADQVRQRAAGPLYRQAFKDAPEVDITDTLGKIRRLKETAPRGGHAEKALNKVMKMLTRESAPPGPAGLKTPAAPRAARQPAILGDAPFTPGSVETGKPLRFHYLKSKEKAPDMGVEFAQDIEPAGKYVASASPGVKRNPQQFEYGVADLKNPLVIEHKTSRHGGWKTDLQEKYGGKTGAELSRAIQAEGYDGIVTIDKGRISESVLFATRKAKDIAKDIKTTLPGGEKGAVSLYDELNAEQKQAIARLVQDGKDATEYIKKIAIAGKPISADAAAQIQKEIIRDPAKMFLGLDQEQRLVVLDNVKKEIDAMLGGPEGASIHKDMQRQIMEVKDSLTTQMDKASPTYQQARKVYGDESAIPEALKDSKVAQLSRLKGDKAENAAKIVFSPGQSSPEIVSMTKEAIIKHGGQDAWDALLRTHIKDKFRDVVKSGTMNLGGALRKKLFGDIGQREILKEAMTPAQYETFENFMRVLERAGMTSGKESATATRLVSLTDLNAEATGAMGKAQRAIAYPLFTWKKAVVDWHQTMKSEAYQDMLADAMLSEKSAIQLQKMLQLKPGSETLIRQLSTFLTMIGSGELRRSAGRTARGIAPGTLRYIPPQNPLLQLQR